MVTDTDVIIVGAGLAGLVAAAELSDAGKRVIMVEQEPAIESWRPGILVLWGVVSRRFSRAAPYGHPRLV